MKQVLPEAALHLETCFFIAAERRLVLRVQSEDLFYEGSAG